MAPFVPTQRRATSPMVARLRNQRAATLWLLSALSAVPGPDSSMAGIESAMGEASRWRLPKLWSRRRAVVSGPEKQPEEPLDTAACSLPLNDADKVVSCAGAGIFVFWQLGALKYISTHFDLSNVTLHGGSAGAVLSTFIASGVDLNHAVRVSYDIGMEARVWDRWNHFGLFGPLIRKWLEILLPDDAHIRCSNRVRILLTRVPGFRQQYVSQFATREELINAVMASVHVPFFLNWKPLKSFRGAYYMDGTLDDFVTGENSPILGCNGKAFVVDYYEDPKLSFNRLDFLKLKTHKQVLHLVAYGHRYARELDMKGGLDPALQDLRVVPSGETARAQTHVVRAELKS
uniref:PNPLA domain-containing protein n=1 Tax=Lotharella oceanica TaxID=641309 RepID=A0A7S2XFS4_9EUKA|mmetsp:Transcript_37366/g.68888  ORF Transcript_37366/g.68888 Transcript_37366/m.68888 type:complete len:346 (+) Transcript_37366:59-1096(+)